MALFRALETAPSAKRRLYEDRFASAFLSPGLRLVASLSKLPLANALVRMYAVARVGSVT